MKRINNRDRPPSDLDTENVPLTDARNAVSETEYQIDNNQGHRGLCSCLRSGCFQAWQLCLNWNQITCEDRNPAGNCARGHRNSESSYRRGRYQLWDGCDELESLDFDDSNNPFEVDACRKPLRTSIRNSLIGPNFTRWTITVVIGISVAASAQLIQFLISFISSVRNDFLQSWIDDELSATAWSGGESTALSRASAVAILFTSYNALLVLVASIFTAYLEPSTATDGIAEIKVWFPSHVSRASASPR